MTEEQPVQKADKSIIVEDRLDQIESAHSALRKDLEALKKEGAVKKRDSWDKLSAINPLISGVLLSGIGLYFAYSNNQAQLKVQEIQTIEKLIPHLTGSETEKKVAIIAISSLTNSQLASKIASMLPSEGSVSALKTLSKNTEGSDKKVAQQSLAVSYKALAEEAETSSSNEKAEEFYGKALQEEEKLYGKDSPRLIESLAKLGNLYSSSGKLNRAAGLLGRSLLIQKNQNLSQSASYQNTKTLLYTVLKAQGKDSLAQSLDKNEIAVANELVASQVADSTGKEVSEPITTEEKTASPDASSSSSGAAAGSSSTDSGTNPNTTNTDSDASSPTMLQPSDNGNSHAPQ